jgi:NADH-ubiquinone oxidoreductase chain 1
VLINVAFVTLLERKILGYSQLRLGPNKISFMGVLQPFRDAIKLFAKQYELNSNVNWKLFSMSPCFILSISVTLWLILPLNGYGRNWPLRIISLLAVLRLGVYPILLSGWSSNSKYAIMGSIRGVAQTISYEIRLALIIMQFIVIFIRVNLKDHFGCSTFGLLLAPLTGLVWVVLLLAETNRTPFDFAEGESELVSGFNIEYASIGFVLIFLREYASIIMFSTLSIVVFFNSQVFSPTTAILSLFITTLWVLIRATLPRYRYDKLINVAWKRYLPIRLGIISLIRVFLFF